MSLASQLELVAGRDLWHVGPVKMTDGPSGARGGQYTGGPASTSFPCGAALGATWDVELVERVGAALAAEARAKGAHVLLGPTVNLHRTPIGGRNFECFAEDPFLTARLCVAYVQGLQGAGVAACVKHLVANDTEHERFTISSEVSERVLREVYLPPFEAAILEAGAWSVMAAYNRLDGEYCTEHSGLLTGLLRDEWGWDGVVVSDWWATHSTVAAANAGLDVEMPGPPEHFGDRLREAVERGEVDRRTVDEKVARVRLLAERTGADGSTTEERYEDDPARAALAHEAAVAGIVLLRNEPVDGTPVLPLQTPPGTVVAVIGPNADAAHVQGGGSAQVTPPYAVTPLQGITARLPAHAAVSHERGCVARRGTPPLAVGQVDLTWTAGGATVATETLPEARFRWKEGADAVAATAAYVPPETGRYVFKVRTAAPFRLWVGDEAVLDGTGPAGEVDLESGVTTTVRLEASLVEGAGPLLVFDVRYAPPVPDDLLERAVAAAAEAEVAVVVVGLDSEWETEGRDRDGLELPGGQDALVQAVAAVNPRTVVVVNAGSPVAMPWVDDVAAVVQLWYPGQEGGRALADVLFGHADPGGRLPTTIPVRLEDTPAFHSYPGERGRMDYAEGVFVGHRWYDARRIEPRFPFGHGLSYASFDYGEPRIDRRDDDPEEVAEVAVDVRNTSARPGLEVVQVYVADPEASVRRPRRELKGFAKLVIDPGAVATARIVLDRRSLSFWDPDERVWKLEPGRFEIAVGRSSRDLRGRVDLVVDADPTEEGDA